MNIYLIVTLVGEYCCRRRTILETCIAILELHVLSRSFLISRFLSTLTGRGEGGLTWAYVILVLRVAACEVICRELFQHL